MISENNKIRFTKKHRSSKRFLAWTLAFLLFLMAVAPVFAADIKDSESSKNSISTHPELTEPLEEYSKATPPDAERPPEQSDDSETILEDTSLSQASTSSNTSKIPVLPDSEDTPLLFDAWLSMEGEDTEPGIYGVLSYIPENTTQITPMYSYNGSEFEAVQGRNWDLSYPSGGMIQQTQLCIGAADYPLTVFNPETDDLYVKLYISCTDGDIVTETVKIIDYSLEPIPEFTAELVEDGEHPGIYGTLNFIPENTVKIQVAYSFGGEQFDYFTDTNWNLTDLAEGDASLTQLCIEAGEHPLTAYQRELVNNLYIKLYITITIPEDSSGSDRCIETEPFRFSHGKTYPIPDIPLDFTASVQTSSGYYYLEGHFKDFPPDAVSIRPMYSFDGENYQYVGISEWTSYDWTFNNIGIDDEKDDLQNQQCAAASDEPLKSYLAKRVDQFYIRLEITTDRGETYGTQAALVKRSLVSIPENATLGAYFPFTMRTFAGDANPVKNYGQYQITVKEDATAEDIYSLLPDTLPVEVKLLENDTGKFIASGIVPCEVLWKTLPQLNLTASEVLTLNDAAEALVVPKGTEVATPHGIYILPESLTFDDLYCTDEVRLALNVIHKDDKPDVSLIQRLEYWSPDDGIIALAFRNKPSGASSIKAYSFVGEDDEWTELGDLLDYRNLNHNQGAALYGYINLLQPDQSPLLDYLNGDIPGFHIGLVIEGGIFDGEQVILPWPGDYDPPLEIYEPDSSEGNENGAGSGNGNDGSNGGSNDGSNGGLHPDIPDKDKPPLLVPPGADLDPDTDNAESDANAIPLEIPKNDNPDSVTVPLYEQTAIPALPATPENKSSVSNDEAQSGKDIVEQKQSDTKKLQPADFPIKKFSKKTLLTVEIAPPKPEAPEQMEPELGAHSTELAEKIFLLGIAVSVTVVGSTLGNAGVIMAVRNYLISVKKLFFHR